MPASTDAPGVPEEEVPQPRDEGDTSLVEHDDGQDPDGTEQGPEDKDAA